MAYEQVGDSNKARPFWKNYIQLEPSGTWTEIARRLRSGMASVNSVLSFAGIPSLPFGGVGDSGFGRIHGADGLREMTRPKAVARQRIAAPVALTSFDRGASVDRTVGRALSLLHGRAPRRRSPRS